MGNKNKDQTKERNSVQFLEIGGGGKSESPQGDSGSSAPPAMGSVEGSYTVLPREPVPAGTCQDVSESEMQGQTYPRELYPKNTIPPSEESDGFDAWALRVHRTRRDTKKMRLTGFFDNPLAGEPALTAADHTGNEVRQIEDCVLEKSAPNSHEVVLMASVPSLVVSRKEGATRWDEASSEKNEEGRLLNDDDIGLSNWHQKRRTSCKKNTHPQSVGTWMTAKGVLGFDRNR